MILCPNYGCRFALNLLMSSRLSAFQFATQVHKIVDLSSCPDREAMWHLEVIEAYKLFYLPAFGEWCKYSLHSLMYFLLSLSPILCFFVYCSISFAAHLHMISSYSTDAKCSFILCQIYGCQQAGPGLSRTQNFELIRPGLYGLNYSKFWYS